MLKNPFTLKHPELTFIPASPAGQILTEKGASPQILIPNGGETATDCTAFIPTTT